MGVIKALHTQSLLPRIISASGGDCLLAALIGVTPLPRLQGVLDGSGIALLRKMDGIFAEGNASFTIGMFGPPCRYFVDLSANVNDAAFDWDP